MVVIARHLMNYNKPTLQRYYIRLMLLIPIYSFCTYSMFILYPAAEFISMIRDLYEGYAIYSLYPLLLCSFITWLNQNEIIKQNSKTHTRTKGEMVRLTFLKDKLLYTYSYFIHSFMNIITKMKWNEIKWSRVEWIEITTTTSIPCAHRRVHSLMLMAAHCGGTHCMEHCIRDKMAKRIKV